MSNINSNNIANSKGFKVCMNKTLDQATTDIDKLPYLANILDIDSDLQLEGFKILWLALKNVMAKRIAMKLDINLPYIGYLKIRHKNKFAIVNKEKVAKDLGYIDWINIPKDKLNEALAKVKILTTDQIVAEKANGVRKRAKHNSVKPKVFKIKLKRLDIV